jgi:hypothetical protein
LPESKAIAGNKKISAMKESQPSVAIKNATVSFPVI